MTMSHLDFEQVLPLVLDEANTALRVENVSGVLVPGFYDEIDLTYVPSGNGAGEIQTVVYKLASATVATLTLTYNSDNKLTSVVKS